MLRDKMFKNERTKIFSSLFRINWQGKKVWEHIRDGSLTATPAFEGELYQTANTKIMFVGRDLNGWDAALANCSTLENTVESITDQSGAFETFVDANGFGEEGSRKYYHKNSNFFRFIKHILEFVGESDPDIDKTWYCDSKQWNQRFVWANLYCISPRNPKSMDESHLDNALVKLGVNDYVNLMELYIDYYKPDVVVFITDVYGWFVRWTRLRSFKDIVENYQEDLTNNIIAATGNIGNTKILVCKRPDRRGTSHDQVKSMAEAISKQILMHKEEVQINTHEK